jgi:hypothetical protein
VLEIARTRTINRAGRATFLGFLSERRDG